MAKDIRVVAQHDGYSLVEVSPGGTYVARCDAGDFQSRKSTSPGPPERAVTEHRKDKGCGDG